MTTFRGKPIKRGGGGFPLPPTHMADGSLKYPDGPPKPEHIDYTEKPEPPKKNDGYYTENPEPPKKEEE